MGAGVSVSVALLSLGLGSVVPTGTEALAVLTRLPVAFGSMVATTVIVIVPPAARLPVTLMLPEPLTGLLEPLPVKVAVQVAPVMAAGKMSVKVPPTMSLGPLLVTTMM